MTITIMHTPADGTVVDGTARGDGSADILKTRGFRWSRHVGWYIRGSRDQAPRTWIINAAADALREAGFDVDVQVEDGYRSTAEREAARAERIEARQDALDAKADRRAAQSNAADAAARSIADRIPFGQPILVGHHSEGRARRDAARIESNTRKSYALAGEATAAATKADASRSSQSYRMSAPATANRITRLETELRDIDRRLDGTSRNGMAYGEKAEGAYRERLLVERARLVDAIDYWKGHLAELEASGVKVWRPDDFAKGDRVRVKGSWGRVVRVNPKTLTVATDSWPENPLKYVYADVREKGVKE